ncbi:MerR family transcriptional regulator [Eubacteriaceae bacterium ES2]|nr:MerR family transcriptional regulator [Eubacteriaceae bacterium ES2]
MEYTIKELADLAGVSNRTLRYYDEIDLLSPQRINQSGYRIYGSAQVNRLQQILFYRELDIDLKTIQTILKNPDYNRLASLKSHLDALTAKQKRTQELIDTLKKTILEEEGKTSMKDQEKFVGFKKEKIAQNEAQYGTEIRQKYGDKNIDATNQKFMTLSQEEYESTEALGVKINSLLEEAVLAGHLPESETGKNLALLHQQWIKAYWTTYSIQAHHGLGQMYVADERFKAYYDGNVPGCAEFLCAAIHHWIK